MRAAFTNAAHMHLYVIYLVMAGFAVVFLAIGLRNLRRQGLPRPFRHEVRRSAPARPCWPGPSSIVALLAGLA